MGDARIPVSEETRDELLTPLKRGNDTYDDVIRREIGNGGETPMLSEIASRLAAIEARLDTLENGGGRGGDDD